MIFYFEHIMLTPLVKGHLYFAQLITILLFRYIYIYIYSFVSLLVSKINHPCTDINYSFYMMLVPVLFILCIYKYLINNTKVEISSNDQDGCRNKATLNTVDVFDGEFYHF
jgi:hypothetical protein